MIYSRATIHGYMRQAELISKSRNEIVIEIGEERISIHPGDEITILEDPFRGDWEAPGNPIFDTMCFDELCEYVKGMSTGDDFYDGIGINVIRGQGN